MLEKRSIILIAAIVGILLMGSVAAYFLYPREMPEGVLDVSGGSAGAVEGIVTFEGIECSDPKTFKVPPCTGVYAGAVIHVYEDESFEEVGSLKTNDKGIFKMRLPAGKYVVLVEELDKPNNMYSQNFEVQSSRPTALVIRMKKT